MATPSPPIDIRSPSRYSSSSPRNQASNLTSALQQAGATLSNNVINGKRSGDEAIPPVARRDSLGFGLTYGSSQSAARPISCAGKPRRESMAGSFVGDRSWGGISVGSWLQDDIMMGGTSPYNMQSPSYHSSSYLPKMEANFWNNLKCCDIVFNDLHQLLQHFEEVHSQAPQTFPYRMSQSGPRRKSSSLPGLSGLAQAQNDQAPPGNPTRGFQPISDSRLNATQSSIQPNQDGFNKSSLSNMQDVDALGDMEMDDDQMQPAHRGLPSFQQKNDSRNYPALLNTNLANVMNSQPAFQGSSPSTPVASHQAFPRQNNPMVSAVNTPTLGTQPLLHRQHMTSPDSTNPGTPVEPDFGFGVDQFSMNNIPYNPQLLQNLNANFGNLDFGNGHDMLDLCINDPAKALFSEHGGINTQQFPHFNFSTGALIDADEGARTLRAQHLAANMGTRVKASGDEARPFRCPVIGCEKAYKNANGLRYHEKHGHASQKLKENGDGTFSIVDPVTSIPYPGTVGMEKEKPYRCETCGKRYKNLNGLKYHRNHSPPCNPDFSFNNNPALAGMQTTVAGDIY